MSDDYFDTLMAYWKEHLDHIIPASRVYLGRNIQDQSGRSDEYAVVFPLAGEEPVEDTGDTIIETLPFEIHIHGPTDNVIKLGKAVYRAFNEGPAITENTMELQRTARRYIRESTDLHHFILRYEWMRYFDEAAA